MKIAHTAWKTYTRPKQTVIDYFTTSNLYGMTVSGSAVTSSSLTTSISSAVKSSVRPANIGIGLYNKQCAKELQKIARFENGATKVFNVLAYGVAALDVGIGIYNNVQNGAPTKKVIVDAAVDVAVSGASIYAAGALGSKIGTAVGTFFAPGVGNIVGAAAGFVIGAGLYVLTDMVYYKGKTGREWAKEAANNLW